MDWTSKEKWVEDHSVQNTTPFTAAKGLAAVVDFRQDSTNDLNVDLKVKGVFVGTLEEKEPDVAGFEDLSLFLIKNNLRVIAPRSARTDDEVWVLLGASKSVLLRRDGLGLDGYLKSYGFLGEVLVCELETGAFSDIMYGKMIDMAQRYFSSVRMEHIWIV